jgi:hypothetical protein
MLKVSRFYSHENIAYRCKGVAHHVHQLEVELYQNFFSILQLFTNHTSLQFILFLIPKLKKIVLLMIHNVFSLTSNFYEQECTVITFNQAHD